MWSDKPNFKPRIQVTELFSVILTWFQNRRIKWMSSKDGNWPGPCAPSENSCVTLTVLPYQRALTQHTSQTARCAAAPNSSPTGKEAEVIVSCWYIPQHWTAKAGAASRVIQDILENETAAALPLWGLCSNLPSAVGTLSCPSHPHSGTPCRFVEQFGENH